MFGNAAALLDPGRPPVDRGALPAGLAASGFDEKELSQFGDENLYEKINGRADFFRSRGFVQLTFVKLEADDDPSMTVDVDFYDMGTPQNALGAYSAERSPEAYTTTEAGTNHHRDATRCSFRVAATMFARSARTTASASCHNSPTCAPGCTRRWSVPRGRGPTSCSPAWASSPASWLSPRKTRSASASRAVWSAVLDDDETEVFVTLASDEQAAATLRQQFVDGFLSYGEQAQVGEQRFVKDRYLGSYATAQNTGLLVYGVRGAPGADAARAALDRLAASVRDLPSGALAAAAESQP